MPLACSRLIRLFAVLLFLGGTASCDSRHVLGRELVKQGCGTFVAGNDLKVCSAGFVGNQLAPIEPAVDVGIDGALVLSSQDLAVLPVAVLNKLGAGNAGIVRVEPGSRQILSASVLGSQIVDIEVSRSQGFIAVLGQPFGVALLSADGARLLWSAPIQGERVSVGWDATVAVWAGGTATVSVFSSAGTKLSSFPTRIAGPLGDVTVDGVNKLVFVTGAAAGEMVGQPVLDAFDYQGLSRWRNYDNTKADVQTQQLTAVSTGVRVQMGLDEQLYFLGESHGGNTVFSRDPRQLLEPAPIVSFDAYNTPYNTNQAILFVARLVPSTGVFSLGQLLLARAPGTAPPKGVPTHANAIAADEFGQVLVSGTHACCGPNASKLTVAGQAVKDSASDVFALQLASDFRSRSLWTTFGSAGASVAGGVAIGAGVAAVVALQAEADIALGPLLQAQPVVPLKPIVGFGAYLAFWPSP
jgi:hypothetical protein